MDAINDFEQVTVLNMHRRQDRWDRLMENVNSFQWPFKKIERYSAIDGWKLPAIDGWGDGMRGAWGCSNGHRRILEAAILDGVAERGGSILVMEDDCTFRSSFPEEYATFRQHLPDDWEFLFLGGQSNGNLTPVNPHVAKVGWANRWHCYAVRGKMIADLYAYLNAHPGHCDLVTWPFLRDRKTYAPTPRWLACQAPSWSDIASNQNTYTRCWNEAPQHAAALYLRCPRDVAEELYRMQVCHPGFNRDPDTGVDCYLRDQINQHGRKGSAIVSAIRGFVQGLKGEAIGIGAGVIATLWEPGLPTQTARLALDQNRIEVQADTISEAIEKLLTATGDNEKSISSASR